MPGCNRIFLVSTTSFVPTWLNPENLAMSDQSIRSAGLRPGANVAQTAGLPCRRPPVCRSRNIPTTSVAPSAQPTGSRRYGRPAVRATSPALRIALPLFAVLLFGPTLRAGEGSSVIQFGGVPMELTVSEVSERTVRVVLSPLDEQGRARTGAPSTVLVPFS